MTTWCQERYGPEHKIPVLDRKHLPKAGARCALEIGHDGGHLFVRDVPLPSKMDPGLTEIVQTAESVGCAITLLGRNDHRHVPADIRDRLVKVRSALSVIHSEIIDLVKED